MRYLFLSSIVTSALAGVIYLGLSLWPIGEQENLTELNGNVARGVYLARISGCIACHTNNGGGKPLVGGHKLATDFGDFFTPNLTTSKEFGIGAWSLSDFSRAVRQGVSPEGKPYYPAFPYDFYAKLSDQDITDLWAAFKTVPADETVSKPHDLYFPFNVRDGLKIWRSVFLDFPEPSPDPEKTTKWNRGKFLVDGPLHCGACHTDRNLLGARKKNNYLQGASRLPDGGKSPAISIIALKKNEWDASSLSYALRTGVKADGDVFGGSMGDVVKHGTAFLSKEDMDALVSYLLDLDN